LGGYGGDTVPKAPKFAAPAFGEWLKAQRGSRSLEWVAERLRNAQPKGARLKINRTNVEKWESGRVPNWLILRAFSVVYDQPYELLTTKLANAVVVEVVDANNTEQNLPIYVLKPHVENDVATTGSSNSQELRDTEIGATVAKHEPVSAIVDGGGHSSVSEAPLTLDGVLDRLDRHTLSRIAVSVAGALRRSTTRSRRSLPTTRTDESGSGA
jgi:hypothetical protein